MNHMIQDKAVGFIRDARDDAQNKWGDQTHDFPVWMAILTEEVGEASKEVLTLRQAISSFERNPTQDNYSRVRDRLHCLVHELSQVGAMALATMEKVIDLQEQLPTYNYSRSQPFMSIFHENNVAGFE